MYDIFILIIIIYILCIYVSLFYLPALIFNNTFIIKYIKFIINTLFMLTIKVSNNKIYIANDLVNLKILYEYNNQNLINKYKFINNYEFKLNLKNTNLIDIIICNHISSYDTIILSSYLSNYNLNFVAKNILKYIPGIGIIGYFNNGILINRKWHDDKSTIINILNKYTYDKSKQIIIIFPEGTRITKDKLLEGQRFSKENNLPIYNNLLVPKTKGIKCILEHLIKNNRLGNIWDITIINSCKSLKFMEEKFSEKHILYDLTNQKFKNNYIIIHNISFIKKYIFNNDEFKINFLDLWKIKDNVISNYNNYLYNKYDLNINYNHIYFCIILIIISFILLNYKYTRYYMLISFLCLYMIMIFKK